MPTHLPGFGVVIKDEHIGAEAGHAGLDFALHGPRRYCGVDRSPAFARGVDRATFERRIAGEIDEQVPEHQRRPGDEIAVLRIGDAKIVGDDRGRHRERKLLRHVDPV